MELGPLATLSRVHPLRRIALVALVLFALLGGTASPASAAPGQVVGGDGNIASHVTDNGSTAKVTFDAGSIMNSCPSGMSQCFLQYRWRSRKDCLICWWANDTNWISMPTGTTQLTHCDAPGNFRFDLQVRLVWNAPQTKTVETWGRNEYRFQIDVSTPGNYRIPSSVFNVTNSSGFPRSVQNRHQHCHD